MYVYHIAISYKQIYLFVMKVCINKWSFCDATVTVRSTKRIIMMSYYIFCRLRTERRWAAAAQISNSLFPRCVQKRQQPSPRVQEGREGKGEAGGGTVGGENEGGGEERMCTDMEIDVSDQTFSWQQVLTRHEGPRRIYKSSMDPFRLVRKLTSQCKNYVLIWNGFIGVIKGFILI